MANKEKLMVLFEEARSLYGCSGACLFECVWERIDAALAEPVDDYDIDAEIRLHKEDRLRLRVENLRLTRERDEARAALSALCAEFEGAVAHADWKANGSKGMHVSFTGDFASVTQLPSAIGRMRWWAREIRKVLEDKP